MKGQSFGRYKVTERIGAGGMGEIYAAVHELMGREAVVKVLLPLIASNETLVKRFFEEARAAARIQHPGIVEVFDVGWTEDGRAFLVMEKLDGESLKGYLDRCGTLSVDETCGLIGQLIRAMEAAHQHGIVHRDLKPDNIFIIPDPDVSGGRRVKVLDFGLAKMTERQGSLATMTGTVFGTPAYMAPEQCKDAANLDHRADLYAIGCVLYRCLCGRPPFNEGGSMEVMAAQLRDRPVPPRQREPSIPAPIDGIVMKLLEKQPDRRFSSCRDLADGLDRALAESRLSSPPAASPAVMSPGASRPGSPSPEAGPSPADVTTSVDTPRLAPRPDASAATRTATPVPGDRLPLPLPPGPRSNTESSFARGVTSVPGPENRRSRVVITAALLAGLGMAVAWLAMEAGEDAVTGPELSDSRPTTSADVASQETPGAAAEGAVGTVDHEVDPEVTGQIDQLLHETGEALQGEDWNAALDKALRAFDLAANDQARREMAQRFREIAQSELNNAATFERLRKAISEKNIANIVDYFGQLPADSIYREKSAAAYSRITGDWLQERSRMAARSSKRGKCEDLEELISTVKSLFPETRDFDVAMAECVEARDRRRETGERDDDDEPDPGESRDTGGVIGLGGEHGEKGEDEQRKTSARLAFHEVQSAMKRNFYGKAFRHCQEVLEFDPTMTSAKVLCSIAACKIAEGAWVRRRYKRLPASGRAQVLQTCLAQGIDPRTQPSPSPDSTTGSDEKK